jgi:hypothetical protein
MLEARATLSDWAGQRPVRGIRLIVLPVGVADLAGASPWRGS